ncbi:MAG TPA: type II secretion system F family protein [Anaerolineaceae bacterium]|jgi:tight adherence protein C
MVPIIILAVLVVLGAIVLVIIGVNAPQGDDAALSRRLEEFSIRGETVNLEELELSQPFAERIVYPIARKLGELAIRFTPENALRSTTKKLELAGNPGRIDPTMFLTMRFVCGLVFGGLLFLVFSVAPQKLPLGRELLIITAFVVLGFFFPELWIGSIIARRQKEVRKAMPDALDLLTICVEAGLGFDAAMAKVSEKWENELSLAFGRSIREVQLGKVRRDALRDMAERLGIPEMTSFVAAVIQSEQLGVSMAKVLRIQSDQMRMKRRQRAEEEAHKAPIKMLIPMVALIFPSLMIVLLTPAALRLLQSSLGAMMR